MRGIFRLSVLLRIFLIVEGPGLLILYRPLDISHECSFSSHLRYDLSFGMGMSDTITLVFRTLNSMDYECMVEIVSDSRDMHLVIVIMFPNPVGINCFYNPNAFAVLKMDECFKLCDTLLHRNANSPYYAANMKERFRFRFASNSSINADMNAHMYQVTATAARLKHPSEKGCNPRNETICVNGDDEFCFTSGVVCDGIKNCGVADWFDERKLECGLPVERLGLAPVFAVTAAILCAAMAAGRLLIRCLPPMANSYFVFNANEDNRLYMDTVFLPPDGGPRHAESVPRPSLVPVSSSSTSHDDSESKQSEIIASDMDELEMLEKKSAILKHIEHEQDPKNSRRQTNAMGSMTRNIQKKFRAVTTLGKTRKSKDVNISEI